MPPMTEDDQKFSTRHGSTITAISADADMPTRTRPPRTTWRLPGWERLVRRRLFGVSPCELDIELAVTLPTKIREELVSAPKIRDALVQLLEDPSFRSGTEQLRQEIMSRPSPNDAVPELERLTAKHRSDRSG
jgi:hypothetical protein